MKPVNLNWEVRIRSKKFWLAMIPAVLLVIQIVASWFGVNFAADLVGAELTNFVNAVFIVLTLLGIVTDPTTSGVGDSKRALSYSKPKKDGE